MLDKSWTHLASCLHCKNNLNCYISVGIGNKCYYFSQEAKIKLTPFRCEAVRKHADIRITSFICANLKVLF